MANGGPADGSRKLKRLLQSVPADTLAALLGVSPRTARGYARQGRIPPARMARLRSEAAAEELARSRAEELARRRATGLPELRKVLAKTRTKREAASLIGVHPSTLRRWLKAGRVPEARRPSVSQVRESFAQRRDARQASRAAFERLMREAGLKGLLPKGKSKEGERRGPRTSGRFTTKAWNRIANYDWLQEFEAWASSIRGNLPLWQIITTVSEYTPGMMIGERAGGPGRKGYTTVVQQFAPDSGDFAISEEVPTIIGPKRKVVEYASNQIAEALESGSIVHVHQTTIINFRKRSEEERKKWETQQRNIRARKLKRERMKQEKNVAKKAAKLRGKK